MSMYFCFVYMCLERNRRNKLSTEIKIALGANASAQRFGKMLHLHFGKETNGTRDPWHQNDIQKHLYNLHACGDGVRIVCRLNCSAKQQYLYMLAFKREYRNTRGVIQFVWFPTKRLSLRGAHICYTSCIEYSRILKDLWREYVGAIKFQKWLTLKKCWNGSWNYVTKQNIVTIYGQLNIKSNSLSS